MPAVDLEGQVTQTGPGTFLGRLLRCMWLPIAIADELTEAQPARPVRVLAEDLVLFRAAAGRAGLIQARCPHGGYPLALGSVEETGIVCARHGWHFDLDGNCFVVNFTGTVYPMAWAHAKTYPVRELAGVLWSYLGPSASGEPPLPDHPLLAGRPLAESQALLDVPWLAAREALPATSGTPLGWLLLPVDDTHSWRVGLTTGTELPARSPQAGTPTVRAAVLRALARIESGEEPGTVAMALANCLIVAGGG